MTKKKQMKQINWKPLQKGDRVRVMGFDIYGHDITGIAATVTETWSSGGSVGIDTGLRLTYVHRCQLRKIVKKEKKEPRRLWAWFNREELAGICCNRPTLRGRCAHTDKQDHVESCFDEDYKEFVEVVKK